MMFAERADYFQPPFADPAMNPDRSLTARLAPVLEKFVEEFLPKAVRWSLLVCSSAMVLSCLSRILFDPSRFKGADSLPNAFFYYTAVITLFTLFYAALALVLIALYHRYKHMPVWPSVRNGTLILTATVLVYGVFVSSQFWFR
jgi:lipid-A-disaccharide synthase-like uncharacterized protein